MGPEVEGPAALAEALNVIDIHGGTADARDGRAHVRVAPGTPEQDWLRLVLSHNRDLLLAVVRGRASHPGPFDLLVVVDDDGSLIAVPAHGPPGLLRLPGEPAWRHRLRAGWEKERFSRRREELGRDGTDREERPTGQPPAREGPPVCPGCRQPAANYPPSFEDSGRDWWCTDCLNERARAARMYVHGYRRDDGLGPTWSDVLDHVGLPRIDASSATHAGNAR
jgi:hypothetical protein